LTEKYKIRPYRTGDEEEINKLLQLVFDGWPSFDLSCSALDYWSWKHLDNPFKRSLIVVCVSNNRIVGVDHSIPLRIKIGNRVVLSYYGADLAVHPDFRRMGISKKMDEMCGEPRKEVGVQFYYFVTRNPILVKSYSKFYSRFPHTIINLVRIQDIDKQLKEIPVENAWMMKLGFYAAKLINIITNTIVGTESPNQNLRISEKSKFDDRIDKFWEEISKHYSFIIERREDYLNWRYCDPRSGDFIIKQVEGDGQILGYSVLRINRSRSDYSVGFIVDLLTLPHRLDVADALVSDATRFFDSNDINIVNCQVVKNHPHTKVFKRYGFLNSRIDLHLFYLQVGMLDEMNKLKKSSASKVYFSYGEIDSLPVIMPNYR
jgi:predicted N-acetyltransferase YhbS